MKTLFIVGQCLRLLNSDPWVVPTYKIIDKGIYSYLTESAIKVPGGWQFKGQKIIYMEFMDTTRITVVPCPDIHWSK